MLSIHLLYFREFLLSSFIRKTFTQFKHFFVPIKVFALIRLSIRSCCSTEVSAIKLWLVLHFTHKINKMQRLFFPIDLQVWQLCFQWLFWVKIKRSTETTRWWVTERFFIFSCNNFVFFISSIFCFKSPSFSFFSPP